MGQQQLQEHGFWERGSSGSQSGDDLPSLGEVVFFQRDACEDELALQGCMYAERRAALPMKSSQGSEHRSEEVARAMEQLLVTTIDDSFEELGPKFAALEQHLLRSVVKTELERRELRRRIAEALFTEAFGRNCPWPVFGRALRRIQRLGYTDVERRYHVACLYAQWCREHPEHDARKAQHLLDEAERRIRRLPRGNTRREELLARLSELRTRTGFRSGSED